MISRKRLTVIGVLVLIGLLVNTFPVFALKLLTGEFPIADSALQETQPSIAYNTQRNFYLVVWSNDRLGNDDIQAQKVGADGNLMGGPFYISAGPGNDRWNPDVTYDSVNDRFLVVWEDYDNASLIKGKSIRAKRVDGTGSVMDSNDLIIRAENTTFYTPSSPAVAFSTTSNRYLVVWHEVTHVGTITQSIYRLVLKPDGNLEGIPEEISGSTKTHSAPDIAYNSSVNRYMVVWQEYNSTTFFYDIKGKQVEGNGTLWGEIKTYGDSGKAHQGLVVAVLPNERSGRTFAIAWTYQQGIFVGYGSVFPNNDGIKKGESYAYWAGSSYTLNHIAIAANQRTGTYLMAFQFDKGVMDKSIDVRETDHTFHWEEVFSISGPANDFPEIASGSTIESLVVWQAQPLSITHTNIYGQIFETHFSSYLPLIRK